MKEKYEYLIDKYNVNLVYNPDYYSKNNIFSLSLVVDKIMNTYIIPCDIWCRNNPFSEYELYSWYSVLDNVDYESNVRINRKMELMLTDEIKPGNTMIGISYLLEDEALILRKRIKELLKQKKYNKSFWEEALFYKDNNMTIYARVYNNDDIIEINTYEQLREIDENLENLDPNVILNIANIMGGSINEIKDITIIKKGMSNRSFRFNCKDKNYVLRVPGEGTDKIIDRKYEYNVYQVLKSYKFSENVIYLSPDNGYKISEFLENARLCNPLNVEDVKICMKLLRDFHRCKLQVSHTFDIFKKIEYYEKLWQGKPSIYNDYFETKKKIMSLKPIIESFPREWGLTHIDAIPDNFIFANNEIRLIDWEYAGMQDPHVDIAMFAIYSFYDRKMVDILIDCYFYEGCDNQTRLKIYCYISACGLLWSNWCEYKRFSGVEFGEYSLKQYRYAKEYYSIVKNEIIK